MYNVSGGCHCGNIKLAVCLTATPESYLPRACDCDFCRKHGAAWLSDGQGSLAIDVKDARELVTYRQGSEQAELLLCRRCGVLVSVLLRADDRIYAAVNATALHGAAVFGAEQTVSPQTLSAQDKRKRWQKLRFADVTLEGVGRAV